MCQPPFGRRGIIRVTLKRPVRPASAGQVTGQYLTPNIPLTAARGRATVAAHSIPGAQMQSLQEWLEGSGLTVNDLASLLGITKQSGKTRPSRRHASLLRILAGDSLHIYLLEIDGDIHAENHCRPR